ADDRGERMIRAAVLRERLSGVEIVRGVEPAVREADGAWVASGAATLEGALLGVPFVGIYVVPPVLVRYGHRMIRHGCITPPKLVLESEVVPELLQERATPQALADALEAEIANPSRQYAEFLKLREALGPPDALQRCASYAVELARAT